MSTFAHVAFLHIASGEAMTQQEKCREEFARVLPRIQTHAEIVFRTVACSHRRADLIAEAVGLAWTWWVRLRNKGKDPNQFISALATFAAKAARSGRQVCGQEKAKDVLSPRAQKIHRFAVGTLPVFSTLTVNPFAEALADNTKTPVDEQVAFRLDFPAWLQTYDERHRRIIEGMGSGERTSDLADTFGISSARISQLRREYCMNWELFVGEC
jgi:hypothetical protein